MDARARVFVAGHRGLVGSAILRRLATESFSHVLVQGKDELDLRNEADVLAFFERERPEYVFLAAARVGGIMANSTKPVEFLRDNLLIELSILNAAHRIGVRKLLFLGSSCIYPKLAPQPIPESALLTGPLEPTNEAYALAKIAGIKLCDAYNTEYGTRFVSIMPTNLYGPGDNFDLTSSHVLPALIRKCHEAKLNNLPEVTVWGSGTPRREFLHVDDMADACLFAMRQFDGPGILNIGTGEDVTIAQLAEYVREAVGYPGELRYDRSKPDGTPRKLLDVTRATALGWRARLQLREGIQSTYEWYLQAYKDAGAT